jgi:uncharacterized protein (DUF488 family)
MPRANELKLPRSSPKTQERNKNLWNLHRQNREPDFYTLGYSGRSLGNILEVLQDRRVRTLVDIRTNPVSMYRPEVSKGNLRKALEESGIGYEHLPDLGVPRDIRAKSLTSGSLQVIWDWYDEFVARPYVGTNLHHFLNSLEHPVALMCTELDPHECHRHRLCLALEARGLSGLDI